MEGIHPFREIFNAIKGCLLGSRENFSLTDTKTAPLSPPLPEDDLEIDERLSSFPGEMFAQLLIELPGHRSTIAEAYKAGNLERLRDSIHQLLGGAAYCDAPELTAGLRELRLALKTGDPETIEFYYQRAIDVIDTTLRYSGYRG
jgi:HPt (histidine-containing phosphotransfer) domain-containing protein